MFCRNRWAKKLLFIALFGLAGCSEAPDAGQPAANQAAQNQPVVPQPDAAQSSDEVFIAGPDFVTTVTISVPKEATVGEWVDLKASRKDGPWLRVKNADVPSGVKTYSKEPPSSQANIQSSVAWNIDPPGAARGNLPTDDIVKDDPLARKVMFSAPGQYKISCASSVPTKTMSNVETITIQAKP
ncbi:MAG TPA: hypothetical protein VMJ32_14325 [Pirellulales bacterium]|nr:hypothetical protein [Pirellulales bacterium]